MYYEIDALMCVKIFHLIYMTMLVNNELWLNATFYSLWTLKLKEKMIIWSLNLGLSVW